MLMGENNLKRLFLKENYNGAGGLSLISTALYNIGAWGYDLRPIFFIFKGEC
jgi:hypothetical protein